MEDVTLKGEREEHMYLVNNDDDITFPQQSTDAKGDRREVRMVGRTMCSPQRCPHTVASTREDVTIHDKALRLQTELRLPIG